MEMDSLPPPDHTETAEPGLSSAPPSYRDAQVWKDLEAETGFASCADYLKFYKDVRPDFEDRLKQFQDMASLDEVSAQLWTSIVIYDLSKQEDLPISLTLRRRCHTGTELIQALREPPGTVGVQLVLWSFSPMSLNPEMADALVLGLKLDPQLLEDYKHIGHTCSHPRSEGFRSSQIKRVQGNGMITVLSQNFMPGKDNTVPVLLVASDYFALEQRNLTKEILAGGDFGKPQFHRSALKEKNGYREFENDRCRTGGQPYARAVESFIEQDRFAAPSKAFLLAAATSPLLNVEAHQVRKASNQVRKTYDRLTRRKMDFENPSDYKDLDQDLDRERQELRRTLETAEDHVSQLFRYLGSQAHLDWSKERSCVDIQADWSLLLDEERRLESEVRDYMQLQVGTLALEESRRSIELSNSQIREAKSVRIFTILAFIYVPINLATSIFGMNLKQLNGSGQNFWVFLTTAVIALVITGGSWLSSNRFSKGEAVAWYTERAVAKGAKDKTGEKGKYGLLLRLAMLVWLVRNGHRVWMWYSGAWIAILCNSKAPGKTNRGGPPFYGRPVRACEYVSECSKIEEVQGYHFEVNSGTTDVTWSPLRFLLRSFTGEIREIRSMILPSSVQGRDDPAESLPVSEHDA